MTRSRHFYPCTSFSFLLTEPPPITLWLSTGQQMDELIQNAERSYPMFTEKLKITYEDQDLEGLMKTAKREKAAATQIPKVLVTQVNKDQQGHEVKTKKFRKCNLLLGE